MTFLLLVLWLLAGGFVQALTGMGSISSMLVAALAAMAFLGIALAA